MQKNDLLEKDETIIRVLDMADNKVLIIDCIRLTVPKWVEEKELTEYKPCSLDDLVEQTKIIIKPVDELEPQNKRFAYEHYTLIAGVLPFIDNDKERCYAINKISKQRKTSKQTIKKCLHLYLAYQTISVLAPRKETHERQLTDDEKNMRWALNKYFYTKNKNSLHTVYTLMLKEKYCDASGNLLASYPKMHQFKYFYYKHRKLQTFYISRNGLKDYQRNERPLTGDGVQEFAPAVGTGMLDATVCDIYLVNDVGGIIGRPILTACIDAYSGLCCGYSLSWEGGVYSLRNLMLNTISDKKKLCKKFGIEIKQEQWNCRGLPGLLVTDMGKEYISNTFEQITELGVTIENLPPYRPELKGVVEKFFDVVQSCFKPYLKGKGVIEPDFQERGAHDYRKDACLTMKDFEKIILHCIIYYNSQRTVDNFPYTEKMIAKKIKPYSSEIWNYGLTQQGANIINFDREKLILTLLPRTNGTFSRKGLSVNGIKYNNPNFTERFLQGGNAVVAYNPDDVSTVWLYEKGTYTPFELIEKRFSDKDISSVVSMKKQQRKIVAEYTEENLQAKIDLAAHICTIAGVASKKANADTKGIRANRKKEQMETHIDFMKDGTYYG